VGVACIGEGEGGGGGGTAGCCEAVAVVVGAACREDRPSEGGGLMTEVDVAGVPCAGLDGAVAGCPLALPSTAVGLGGRGGGVVLIKSGQSGRPGPRHLQGGKWRQHLALTDTQWAARQRGCGLQSCCNLALYANMTCLSAILMRYTAISGTILHKIRLHAQVGCMRRLALGLCCHVMSCPTLHHDSTSTKASRPRSVSLT
jgi:hypothetical protein